jgi:hypothetical protein
MLGLLAASVWVWAIVFEKIVSLRKANRDAAAFGRAPVNAPGRGFGFLRLSALPQAQVFIDDRPFGWTPLFDLRLAEGPHDVRLVYSHPDAAQPEERFRVVIPAEEHWVVKRKNLRSTPP